MPCACRLVGDLQRCHRATQTTTPRPLQAAERAAPQSAVRQQTRAHGADTHCGGARYTQTCTMAFLPVLMVLALLVSAEGSIGPSTNISFCTESKECLEYDLVCKTDEYEVRHYGPTRWLSTNAEAYFMGVGAAMAFRRLFQYITGANEEGIQMEMTAPVLVRIPEETKMWEPAIYTLNFPLPAAYQDKPPKPTNDKVYFTEMPDMDVYVRSYGGWMLSVTSRLHAHFLTKELGRVQAAYNHTYHYGVGYDSPLKLLNRHNEVWYVAEGEPVCTDPQEPTPAHTPAPTQTLTSSPTDTPPESPPHTLADSPAIVTPSRLSSDILVNASSRFPSSAPSPPPSDVPARGSSEGPQRPTVSVPPNSAVPSPAEPSTNASRVSSTTPSAEPETTAGPQTANDSQAVTGPQVVTGNQVVTGTQTVTGPQAATGPQAVTTPQADNVPQADTGSWNSTMPRGSPETQTDAEAGAEHDHTH